MTLHELINRYKPGNPFAERAARARLQYENISRPSQRDAAMARAFPLGAGFGRKSDAKRLDRTIDKAVRAVELKRRADGLEAQAQAYDEGKINSQGRAISEASLKRSEKRHAQKATREERIADAKALRKGKEAWQITQSVYCESAGYFKGSARELVAHDHQQAVTKALRDGKEIPDDVLADYPELRTKLNLTSKNHE